MGKSWATDGPHLVVRPPRWWRLGSLAVMGGALAGSGSAVLFGMWGRLMVWPVWFLLALRAWRTMAIVDGRGVRLRRFTWRGFEWSDVEVWTAVRLPRVRRVVVRERSRTTRAGEHVTGRRIWLPGRVTFADVARFLPPHHRVR